MNNKNNFLIKLKDQISEDEICIGLSSVTSSLTLIGQVQYPGVLFEGKFKEEGMVFSLFSHLIKNKEICDYYIFGTNLKKFYPLLELNDTKKVDDFKNLIGLNKSSKIHIYEHNQLPFLKSLNDPNVSSFIKSIEDAYDQLIKRRMLFLETKSSNKVPMVNINEYEKETGLKLSRIMFVCPDFDIFLNQINYYKSLEDSSNISYKIRYLLRIGRSYGIFFIASASLGNSDFGSIRASIKPGFSTQVICNQRKNDQFILRNNEKDNFYYHEWLIPDIKLDEDL